MTLTQWILWALAFACMAASNHRNKRKYEDYARMLDTANYELRRARSILELNQQLHADEVARLRAYITRHRIAGPETLEREAEATKLRYPS